MTAFAGGFFSQIGVGGTLLPWNPNANSSVFALAISGTTAYVGGSFNSLGGRSRGRFAIVNAMDSGEVVQ